MKVRLLLLVSVVILSALSSDLLAQKVKGNNPLYPIEQGSPIYLGPVIGYNRVIHSARLPSFSDDILCPYFENGSSNGFFAGLSFEYLLGDPMNSVSSVIARVLYNTFPASFNKAGVENDHNGYPSYVEKPDGTKETIRSKTEHNIEVTYSTITAEVMYKLNFLGTLGVSVGPTFDFPITKKIYQNMKLIDPLNAQFKRDSATANIRYEDNDRTIVVKDEDIKSASGFRFGLKFGLQYEIITGGKWYVVPSVFYNLGVTKVSSEYDWRIDAIQIGVDIRFAI